jgi:hypothetical protein
MARTYTLADTPPLSPSRLARKRVERAILKGALLLTSLIAMNIWLM